MYSIVWTNKAEREINNIILFWYEKTKSKQYSKKVLTETDRILKLILEAPFIGTVVEYKKSIRRVLVLQNYSLFYKIEEGTIYILSFWDNRQNPDSLTL